MFNNDNYDAADDDDDDHNNNNNNNNNNNRVFIICFSCQGSVNWSTLTVRIATVCHTVLLHII